MTGGKAKVWTCSACEAPFTFGGDSKCKCMCCSLAVSQVSLMHAHVACCTICKHGAWDPTVRDRVNGAPKTSSKTHTKLPRAQRPAPRPEAAATLGGALRGDACSQNCHDVLPQGSP
eukprot:362504-Chlamydomonas_euryale.AAC.6